MSSDAWTDHALVINSATGSTDRSGGRSLTDLLVPVTLEAMSRSLRRPAVVVLVMAALCGASWGAAYGSSAGTLIGGAHPVKATITIDSNDTFAAPPPNAKPKLSAVTAWRRYSRSQGHPQRRPHAGIKIWIGLFTSAHEVHNKLSYGFEEKRPRACATTLPTSHPPRCREWTFVSARTGKSLGIRFQIVKAH
jgi:hypothetical protein